MAGFYHSAAAGFANVLFFPPIVGLVLCYGFFRDRLAKANFELDEEAEGYLEWRRKRYGPSGMLREFDPLDPASGGTVRISVCGRAVDHQAAMALMKRSPKITANCAFAMVHSRGGIFHSFSDRF
ncbi:hypothetical protein, partial [Sphingobium yanoikuyae]|uniref:hypothetical protein n=1 Tax=Sphingobium yanoikuyae TaxID=13690 RepID=UPI001BDBEC35